jgi:hypothetical protein
MYYNITLKRFGQLTLQWKRIIITHSDCATLNLVSRHAMYMRRIILSSVTYLALLYIFTLSHTRYDFQKGVIEYKTCVLILSATFV